MQDKLLIATNNPGKLIEFRQLLNDVQGLELVSPQEISLQLQPEEVGGNYRTNAEIKARDFSRASGLPCLADDSGLEVDVLGGAPGVYSARFAGAGATDSIRRARLLDVIGGNPRPWAARFVCGLCFCFDEIGELKYWEGECAGEIVPIERGRGGFGYDPLFEVANLSLTMAELSVEQKNNFSHRAIATKQALSFLKDFYASR